MLKRLHNGQEKKAREESQPKRDAHPFDNLVKALFGEDGAQIVPELIEGAQVWSAENWEMDPEPILAKHLLPFYILLPAMIQ